MVLGSIAYNAAQQTDQCGSGVDIYEPVQTDTLPGTHIYVSQTFTWANINGFMCGGHAPTDGEGSSSTRLTGLAAASRSIVNRQ